MISSEEKKFLDIFVMSLHVKKAIFIHKTIREELNVHKYE
jgi:hypothetical protein